MPRLSDFAGEALLCRSDQRARTYDAQLIVLRIDAHEHLTAADEAAVDKVRRNIGDPA
jgi:hypothetical protein